MKFQGRGWALVPGPLHLEKVQLSHLLDSDPARYSPDEVASALLSIPGIELLQGASPDWWSWRVGLVGEQDAFEIGMTLFETTPPSWGGSPISTVSEPAELLALLRAVREHLPGVYLHNEGCELYPPQKFAARYLAIR